LDLRERSGHMVGFLPAAERRWRIARKNVDVARERGAWKIYARQRGC